MERDTFSPNIEIVAKLADHFKVSTDYLTNGTARTTEDIKEVLERLREVVAMYEKKYISEEEFKAIKYRLLNNILPI